MEEMVKESVPMPKGKRPAIVATSIVVVAVVFISAISLAVWWHLSQSTPDLEVEVMAINIYGTALAASDGHVVIQLSIDVRNGEHEAVPLDPCDFILETVDGHTQHFAWAVGNLTVISIFGDLSNTSNQDRVLPSGGWGTLWILFEIPLDLTLRNIVWTSTLGEVSSPVSEHINEQLLSFY